MPVDPAVAELLLGVAGAPAYNDLSIGEARSLSKAAASASGLERVEEIESKSVDDVPLRIYRSEATAEDAPIFIWFHGGGFVLGDVERADPLVRRLANRLPARVVSVEYRLAPENPFPAALNDGRAVLAWALRHGVPVAVGGDSAGGNIAARLAIEARDRGDTLCHQLLVYPWLDLTLASGSIGGLAEGYYLTRPLLEWFADHYVPGGMDRGDAILSPFHAPDVAAVAPATVVTAEYDPLRDEGNLYAERLREAGVPVHATCYAGMIHGFFGFTEITPVAQQAIDDAVARVRADLIGASTLEVDVQ